jgi:hypothetical protein
MKIAYKKDRTRYYFKIPKLQYDENSQDVILVRKTMGRSQLGKTTASVSSYYIIIEALGGPSAGPRFKEISIWFESRITIDIIMRNAQWA